MPTSELRRARPGAQAQSKTGLLILAQKQWLDFHLTNSIGKHAFYCRGRGAPVRSLALGHPIFCAQTGESSPHRVHLLGTFEGWETRTSADAWREHGNHLGAKSMDEWLKLISRIPSLVGSGQIGLIRIGNVVAPAAPVPLEPMGIELRRGTIKGRRLSEDESQLILDAVGGR